MRKAPSAMIKGISDEKEYEVLGGLLDECNQFLDTWKAHQPNVSDVSPDAVVAIMLIQLQCVERRSYILGKLHQAEVPF